MDGSFKLYGSFKIVCSLQAYGQKDPVIEYKREAKKSFENFFTEIKEKIKNYILYVDIDFIKKNS